MIAHDERHNFTEYPSYTPKPVSDGIESLNIPDLRKQKGTYNIRFHQRVNSND